MKKEHRKYTKDFHAQLNQALDKTLIYLSSGSFLASLTLLNILDNISGEVWIKAAWIILFLSVVFNLLSTTLSLVHIRKTNKNNWKKINYDWWWRKTIITFHYWSVIFLCSGLFCLLKFALKNVSVI